MFRVFGGFHSGPALPEECALLSLSPAGTPASFVSVVFLSSFPLLFSLKKIPFPFPSSKTLETQGKRIESEDFG